MTEIHGTCDERFDQVRAAFLANFEARGEVGAAVAVELDGRPVVDLWAGSADPASNRPWSDDTLTTVMSVTKGLVAVCALLLWERGELDIDAPVAGVWPEFKAAGKENVTTRQLLSHRAGLPAFDAPISAEECSTPGKAAARLATQGPRWAPGTRHGYHALTFGWLLGEVIERVSGRNVGTFFADEVATPLGLDTYIGLPPELEARASTLQPMSFDYLAGKPLDEKTMAIATRIFDQTSLTFQVLSNPLIDPDAMNSPALHQAGWPAAGGMTTATSLARLYGELACDRVLQPATLDAAEQVQSDGPDEVLVVRTAFGLGFQLTSELCQVVPDGGGFGHDGAGGSVAFADRRIGLSFAYVMNQLSASLGYDDRGHSLVAAVYDCLG